MVVNISSKKKRNQYYQINSEDRYEVTQIRTHYLGLYIFLPAGVSTRNFNHNPYEHIYFHLMYFHPKDNILAEIIKGHSQIDFSIWITVLWHFSVQGIIFHSCSSILYHRISARNIISTTQKIHLNWIDYVTTSLYPISV